ncbi:helix-turn-helix domain containing protein [Streptomyces sp. NPDC060027]|uniref:helix-turn-helix domain containing protein n=1 Tax=Streptomyces sp. NPDC060027 TaxID=3347040 RepID=UPI0036BD715A
MRGVAATHRRTTASGARVRTKAVLITPTGSGTGRVGAQAIAAGSARLRPLIAEAARLGLRLAFTVRLAKTGYVHPSGSRSDSPGVRREVIQHADHTEQRSYVDRRLRRRRLRPRVDAAGGDVTSHRRSPVAGRDRSHRRDAHIIHLEVRTWRPR